MINNDHAYTLGYIKVHFSWCSRILGEGIKCILDIKITYDHTIIDTADERMVS